MTNRETSRRKLNASTLVAALVLIFCVSLVGYLFNVSRAQSEHDRTLLCQAHNESRQALRDIIILARDTAGDATAEGDTFYRKALALLQPLPCEQVGEG